MNDLTYTSDIDLPRPANLAGEPQNISIARHGILFKGAFTENGPKCYEEITAFDPADNREIGVLHACEFPSSYLGRASFAEYARVTLASIVDAYFRKQRMAA